MVRVARNLTRKSLALLTSLLLVLFWVPGLVAATPAGAAASTTIPGSPYNGSNGTIDSASSIHSTTDPAGNSDTTSFTGGKEDDQCPGVTTQGLSSPKDDLTKVYFGSANGTTAATSTDVFLYLAWERSTTNGTTTIDFELNQSTGAMTLCNGVNPQRTAGDLLFTYDFSNGGGSVDINYYVWDTTLNNGDGGWKPKGDITGLLHNGDHVVEAATDNTGIKGEMAVNLSLLPGVFTATQCKDFGAAWGKTRSSTSFGSEIKDFVTPQPTIISNCAPMTIYKQDSAGNPLSGAIFDITGTTPAVQPGQTPCTTRSDGYCYVQIPLSNPPAYAKPLLFPGTYTVTESTPPSGYLLASPAFQSVTVPQTTNPATHAGEAVFTDPLGSLTFFKVDAQATSTPVGGASFLVHRVSGGGTQADVSVTDKTPSSAGSNDTSSVAGTMTVAGLKTGTYRVTETTPLPTGYGQDTSTIYITIDQTHPTGFLSDSSGTAISGTATFQDPRLPVTLRVIKDDGGACNPDAATPSTHCLAGAVFSLYQLRSGAGVTPNIALDTLATTVGANPCTTGANGACTETVPHWGGKYYWYESTAPPGYNLPANRYSTTIDLSSYPTNGIGPDKTFSDSHPGISTAASNATIGGKIHDDATLSTVPAHAHGSISFDIYGPFASAAAITSTSCTQAKYLTTLTNSSIDGAGTYGSGDYTPATPGYYAWVASYSGDAATGAAAVAGACGDSGETSHVSQATPTMTTSATDAHVVLGTFHDTAQLDGYVGPLTGMSVTFTLYSASDCSSQVLFTSTKPFNASGFAQSDDYTATNSTGTYYWKVSVTGNTNNDVSNITDLCGSTTGGNHEVSNAPVIPNPTKAPISGTVKVYAPDNTITYTVTVQNTGGATALGTSVSDPVPAGTTFTSNDSCTGSISGCSFSQPGGVPTWTFDMPAAVGNTPATVTITFTVTADAADTDGQLIHNTATVHSGSYQHDTNTTTHTVIRPLLALGKNSDPLPVEDTPAGGGTVAPGQTITYSLPLQNTGSDAANGVVVTDQVPVHTTYSPSSAHCESDPVTHAALACTAGHSGASPDVVTWTVDVPAHTTVYVVFAVIVDAKASLTNGDQIPNQGHFTWTYSAQSNGPNLTGDSRQIHHVVTFPVITADKSATPDWIEDGASGIVHPGGTIHYVVTVHNGGQAGATGVTVADAIPAGTTYVANSAVPAATLDAFNTLNWTVDVAAGGSTQVAFDVTVDANDADGQLLHNTGVVNGVNTNTTSHIVTIPILDVHKSSSPASGADAAHPTLVGPNTVVTYTLTVTNAGRQDKTGFTVTDSVPTGTTYNGDASCNGAANCVAHESGGVITWTLDVPGGSVSNNVVTPTTRTLTFSVTTPTVQSFLIENTATFPNTHTPGCATTTCDTETTYHQVVFPVINAHKTSSPATGTQANPATVVPGQVITYTIAVDNSGEANATGVVVHDSVPANTTYVDHSADASGGTISSGVITWTINVAAHATVNLSFQVQVPAGATNGTLIDNTATFSNVHTPGCNTTTCSTETTHHMVRFPVITQDKAATPDWIENGASGVVHPGGTIHYVVTVHNSGLAAATGVTVSDAIPAGTTYVTNSAVPSAQLVGGVLSWTINVAALGQTQVAFDVTVDAGDADGQLLHNTAVVNGTNTNTTSHIVTIPIMSVAKSSSPVSGTAANPTLVGPNTVITYTLTVTNAGRQDKTGFTVTDSVPSGTTYNGDASCNGAANCSVQVNSGVITWTLDVPGGTVNGGVVTPTTRTLTFSVTTPTVQSALIDNTASFPNTHTPGCATTTCDTETTHHKVVFPVINAHKTSDPVSGTVANPTTVTPGQVITYSIAVDNSGQAAATGVNVADVVPPNTTYVAGSANQGGSYDSTTNTVSWSVDVAIGQTVTLTFQAKVPDGATNGTLIDNTATFSNVHTPGCNSATCSTETTHHEVRFAILTLAKSSNPVSGSIVQRGDRIDYTITLTNTGLADSPVKTITDTLPSHVTVVSGSASPAFTSASGSTVTWDVVVKAGQTVTLTYAVTVDKDAPEGATLTNVALVDGSCVGNADPSACTTDHHVPTGALTLVKHVDKATASYGDTLTYTFDAATTGALNQTAVTVSDVMPKGTAYVAGSAGCTDAGTCTTSFDAASKTLTWGLGDMAAGATRHLVFKVTIVKPAFNSTTGLPPATIVNAGSIASAETPSTPSNQVVTKVVAVLGVKVVRAPRLPFTGVPAQEMGLVGLLMLGAGIILTSVRRREQ